MKNRGFDDIDFQKEIGLTDEEIKDAYLTEQAIIDFMKAKGINEIEFEDGSYLKLETDYDVEELLNAGLPEEYITTEHVPGRLEDFN